MLVNGRGRGELEATQRRVVGAEEDPMQPSYSSYAWPG